MSEMNTITTSAEREYEESCARYNALPDNEKKRISERHDTMENAQSSLYNARYSRFFASWFNTHPHDEVRETIKEFEKYLEHIGLDEWERSDINQMLIIGKSEIEDNIIKYEETKIERESKDKIIRALKSNGVVDPGLENLSIQTLQQIESSIIRKHIGAKDVTEYTEKELQLITAVKRIKDIKGIDCGFDASTQIHISHMAREAVEFAKNKEKNKVKKVLDCIEEYIRFDMPKDVVLSEELRNAFKDAYHIILT